jgi:hypothetical protein
MFQHLLLPTIERERLRDLEQRRLVAVARLARECCQRGSRGLRAWAARLVARATRPRAIRGA